MTDSSTLTMPDGRTVGFARHGAPDGQPVLWCHGGPGSRLEPATAGPAAAEAGYQLVGIDRPGYGLSSPWPGRSIAAWVPDGLAVADHLGLDRFAIVGVSTGGAYALATAALVPNRVIRVVACSALTDMRWAEGRRMMTFAGTNDVWEAPDRDAALAVAADQFGADGSKFMAPEREGAPELPAPDIAWLTDPDNLSVFAESVAPMFSFGLEGYVDDRIADGVGWGSFDVTSVVAPTTVLHGSVDPLVPVAQARHTAQIVPGASLRIVDDLGHLSITSEIVPTLVG